MLVKRCSNVLALIFFFFLCTEIEYRFFVVFEHSNLLIYVQYKRKIIIIQEYFFFFCGLHIQYDNNLIIKFDLKLMTEM